MAISGFDSLKGLNADAFMKMFITQMTHQDPTNPMDPSSMLSQLADLVGVQKQTEMAETFSNVLHAQQFNLAAGMIGHEIAYRDNGELISAVVESAGEHEGVIGVFAEDRFIPLEEVVEIGGLAPVTT